jgi:hypothetical protein
MRFRLGDFVGLCDLAVGPYEHGNACCAFLVSTFRRAIGQCDGPIGIAQQVGGQAYFIAPLFQVVRRAEGDSQYDGVLVSIVLGSITEPVGLLSSIVAKGAGIEPEQDVLARVIR